LLWQTDEENQLTEVEKEMKKIGIVTSMLLCFLLVGNRVVAQMCHGMGGSGHQHGEKADKKTTGTKMEMKESFYTTVYICPMHPEVQQEKSSKCPKCGMKLEKKQVLMTYACPEKDCEYQKARPGRCPEHKKELVKCEIKSFCPKCGEQINSEDLKQKPIKPTQQIETKEHKEKTIYTCSMCGGEFDKPGKCPKCGMDLVPKNK